MCLLHLLGLEWQTRSRFMTACAMKQLLYFCAQGLWLWLVQDSPAHLLSWFCLSKGAVGGDLQSVELGRRGQQGLKTWREVSQGLGRAAIQQSVMNPGRCRAEPFNSALLCSLVAVISFPCCSNADLSVTDRDYVLSPTGNSESLGGLFCLCLRSFSASELDFPSDPLAALSSSLHAQPVLRDLPCHSLLLSAVPSVLCAPAVCAHKSLLLLTPKAPDFCHLEMDPELFGVLCSCNYSCSLWCPALCVPGCSAPARCHLCGHCRQQLCLLWGGCRTVPWVSPPHISETQGVSWCHQTPRGFWSCWSLHLLRSYLASSVADSSHLFFLPCLCWNTKESRILDIGEDTKENKYQKKSKQRYLITEDMEQQGI